MQEKEIKMIKIGKGNYSYFSGNMISYIREHNYFNKKFLRMMNKVNNKV